MQPPDTITPPIPDPAPVDPDRPTPDPVSVDQAHRLDRFVAWLWRNPRWSFVLLLGAIVIALGNFAGGLTKVIELIQRVRGMSNTSPTSSLSAFVEVLGVNTSDDSGVSFSVVYHNPEPQPFGVRVVTAEATRPSGTVVQECDQQVDATTRRASGDSLLIVNPNTLQEVRYACFPNPLLRNPPFALILSFNIARLSPPEDQQVITSPLINMRRTANDPHAAFGDGFTIALPTPQPTSHKSQSGN